MKKWLTSLAISLATSSLALVYFLLVMAQDKCVESGGVWLGVRSGCNGGNGYALDNLLSPLGVVIALGIVLALCSAFIQIHALLLKRRS